MLATVLIRMLILLSPLHAPPQQNQPAKESNPFTVSTEPELPSRLKDFF